MNNWSSELAGWLLTYALHSTLLLIAALLLIRKLRSAATRDLICKLAAFAALGTASAQNLLPDQTNLQPLAGRWELHVQSSPVSPLVIDAAPSSARPEQESLTSGSAAQLLAPERVRPRLRLPAWPVVVLTIWLASALFGLSLLSIRYSRVRRRFGGRVRSSDVQLLAQVNDLRQSARITRPIVLSVSYGVLSPVALGRSEICLPVVCWRS
jgi:hypothetical protein